MNNYKEKAGENASEIRREIERLRYNHCDPNSPALDTRYLYGDFFRHAKDVVELFKTLKPLARDDRESLWAKYRDLCDGVKYKQNEERSQSSRSRGLLESLLNRAHTQAEYAGDRDGLNKAKASLTEILGEMKGRRLLRNDREYLWDFWVQANEKLKNRRESLQRDGYVVAKHDAEQCSSYVNENPYDALNKIKEVQRELKDMYMNREQRNEVHEILNRVWKSASEKIGEIKEEKRNKYEGWKERTEGNIERWEGNISKAENTISSIRENIDKLEDEANNARTSEHEERVRGWIEEGYEKIRDIESSISETERKISDAKDRLR